jgi:hypothetical protein
VVAESTRRLADELRRTSELWGLTPSFLVSTYDPGQDGASLAALGAPVPFEDAAAAVVDAVGKHLAGRGV